MSTFNSELFKVYAYPNTHDLYGGTNSPKKFQVVAVLNDPRVHYRKGDAAPTTFKQSVEWRGEKTVQIGEAQLPSKAVRIEISYIPNKFTQIILYPEYSEALLELVDWFEPNAKKLLELVLQTPATAIINLHKKSSMIGLTFGKAEDLVWFETPLMSYLDSSDETGLSTKTWGSTTVIEKHLLTLNSDDHTYVVVTGIRIFGEIDKKLEQELLDLSQYNWSELTAIVEPFIEIRQIDKLANVTVY